MSAPLQHTPGLWEDGHITTMNPRIHGGPLRLVKCEGVVIAFVPMWLDDEREEARANARLIAAAPAMLDALQALVERAFPKEARIARPYGKPFFESTDWRASFGLGQPVLLPSAVSGFQGRPQRHTIAEAPSDAQGGD